MATQAPSQAHFSDALALARALQSGLHASSPHRTATHISSILSAVSSGSVSSENVKECVAFIWHNWQISKCEGGSLELLVELCGHCASVPVPERDEASLPIPHDTIIRTLHAMQRSTCLPKDWRSLLLTRCMTSGSTVRDTDLPVIAYHVLMAATASHIQETVPFLLRILDREHLVDSLAFYVSLACKQSSWTLKLFASHLDDVFAAPSASRLSFILHLCDSPHTDLFARVLHMCTQHFEGWKVDAMLSAVSNGCGAKQPLALELLENGHDLSSTFESMVGSIDWAALTSSHIFIPGHRHYRLGLHVLSRVVRQCDQNSLYALVTRTHSAISHHASSSVHDLQAIVDDARVFWETLSLSQMATDGHSSSTSRGTGNEMLHSSNSAAGNLLAIEAKKASSSNRDAQRAWGTVGLLCLSVATSAVNGAVSGAIIRNMLVNGPMRGASSFARQALDSDWPILYALRFGTVSRADIRRSLTDFVQKHPTLSSEQELRTTFAFLMAADEEDPLLTMWALIKTSEFDVKVKSKKQAGNPSHGGGKAKGKGRKEVAVDMYPVPPSVVAARLMLVLQANDPELRDNKEIRAFLTELLLHCSQFGDLDERTWIDLIVKSVTPQFLMHFIDKVKECKSPLEEVFSPAVILRRGPAATPGGPPSLLVSDVCGFFERDPALVQFLYLVYLPKYHASTRTEPKELLECKSPVAVLGLAIYFDHVGQVVQSCNLLLSLLRAMASANEAVIDQRMAVNHDFPELGRRLRTLPGLSNFDAELIIDKSLSFLATKVDELPAMDSVLLVAATLCNFVLSPKQMTVLYSSLKNMNAKLSVRVGKLKKQPDSEEPVRRALVVLLQEVTPRMYAKISGSYKKKSREVTSVPGLVYAMERLEGTVVDALKRLSRASEKDWADVSKNLRRSTVRDFRMDMEGVERVRRKRMRPEKEDGEDDGENEEN